MEKQVISNEKADVEKIQAAKIIITELQNELPSYIKSGCGPFLAAIADKDNNIILKAANSVEMDNLCICHAEINAIKKAHEKFKTYDLSPWDLKIYITSEPCIMCLGAIMWSGIKICVYGNIESELGEKRLKEYLEQGKLIYKPKR